MEEEEEKKGKKKDIQKDTLEPVTKVNTKLDKELQEWEVDSTTSGWEIFPKHWLERFLTFLWNREHTLIFLSQNLWPFGLFQKKVTKEP